MSRNGETRAERGSKKPSPACQKLATTGGAPWRLQCARLNCFNRPARTRMPGGVGWKRPAMAAPYPDSLRDPSRTTPSLAVNRLVMVKSQSSAQTRRLGRASLDAAHAMERCAEEP